MDQTRGLMFQAGELVEQPNGLVELTTGAICPLCINLCLKVFSEDSAPAPTLPRT
jgi:hypothetical protein